MSEDVGDQMSLDEIVDDHSEEDSMEKQIENKDGGTSPETDRVETPIGIIPTDWKVERLDDACNINPDGFFEDAWESETFEYISLSEVSEGEILGSETIPLDEAPSRAQREIKAGDVLVGTVRPKQVSHGLVTKEHNGKICSSGFGVLRPKSNLNGFYLLQEVLSHRFFRQMEAYVAGSGYPAVKIGDLKKHRIGIPPLPEQRKIASILYNVREAIQKTDEIINQIKRVRKGIEQDLFQRGYLEHTDLKEEKIGKIPEDWCFDPLSEHTVESAFGPRFGAERYSEDGNVATLRTTDLDDDGNISKKSMPLADLEPEEYEEHVLQQGDFLITRSGTCGIGTVWDVETAKPTIPGAFLIRFRLKENLNPNFLRHYVNSSIGRKRVERRAKGGVQKNLAGTDLLNMKFPVPSIEEQEKIVEVIEDIRSDIHSNEEYKRRLQSLKRGLMQDLLSGEIRTTDRDIEVLPEVEKYG